MAMKKFLTSIAVLGLLLNLSLFSAWMYSYFNTDAHNEAKAKFSGYLPDWLPMDMLAIVTLLTTIFSMIIFERYKTAKNHDTFTSGMIIQAAFLLLYTWQQL